MKALLAASLFALASFAEARPPNIVLIVADDLGYGDLGCYGSEIHPTPHIDALAEGGLRFTDYHSAGSMCSPTRASMLTGLYPQRFGPEFDGALGNRGGQNPGLPMEAVTLAERLQEKGYATGCFGKWHLGYAPPRIPTRQGFDVFRGLLSGDGDHHTQIDRAGNADWYDGESLRSEEGYTADLLTDHALTFIEKNREMPFFLYLPHLAIHFPWQGRDDPPQRERGIDYQNDKWGLIPDPSNVAPHIRAMLVALDDSVGRVAGSLREHGLEEDTLVIFTSDNGGYLTYGSRFRNISSNGVYRGQKTEVYEGGHRVPLIVSWPGKVKTGISDALAHSNDWMPTLLSLAKADPQESDGVDLGPHLLDRSSVPERTLFWRMRSGHALRRGPWKLCVTGENPELYRLDRDPGETADLASSMPEKVRELRREWEAWNRDVSRSALEIAR